MATAASPGGSREPAGRPARKRGPRPRPLVISADVLARYAAGQLTTREVARRYAVPEPTALRALRAAGADTSRSARQRARSARARSAANREGTDR